MEEIVVKLVSLVQVLLLHLVSDIAVLTVGVCEVARSAGVGRILALYSQHTLSGEQKLVNHDIMGVNLIYGKFLYEALCFV